MSGKSVSFYVSENIDVPLQIKILSLKGKKRQLRASEKLIDPQLSLTMSNVKIFSDMLVSVQVYDELTLGDVTVPVFAPYVPFRYGRNWDQWVTLPVSVRHLTPACKLRIVLWEFNGRRRIPFKTITTPIFKDLDFTLKEVLKQSNLQNKANHPSRPLKLWILSINTFMAITLRKNG